ncbi:unnamed protein product [Closterium sp. Yama58-4]|nr:unnamed protein product [Closterium sp. Yama58-4]
MESAARAALLLKSSRWAAHPVFQRWLRKAEKHIASMAAWFVRPNIEQNGWRNDAVHAHRRYLTGTALGLAGLLTDNETLILKSSEYIRSGLEMQDPAGFNHERQGYDCSYQGIGLVYAARYYLYVAPHIRNGSDSEEIRSRLLEAGRRGVDWLVTRVDERGVLNATGNTRTGSAQELGRNGKPKALARKDVFHALLYWSWVLGDPEVELIAWRVEWERTRRVVGFEVYGIAFIAHELGWRGVQGCVSRPLYWSWVGARWVLGNPNVNIARSPLYKRCDSNVEMVKDALLIQGLAGTGKVGAGVTAGKQLLQLWEL